MKLLIRFLAFFILVVFFTGCSSGEYEENESLAGYNPDDSGALVADLTNSTEALKTEVAKSDQKLIKTGSLSMHMDDVQVGVDAIAALLTQWDGSVLNSSVTQGSTSYYADMTVRVDADQFDAALEGIKELALYVSYEYVDANDVTEAYMDLAARLNNAEAEEQAYLDVMSIATTVEEVLQVTSALADVRYEIESLQSQLSYYDTRVAYSTITLSLTEDESISSVTETWRPVSTAMDAFSVWVVFLQDIVDRGIYLLIFGWPFVIIGWFVWKRRSGKGKK